MSAHGNVSSIPKSRPIRFLRMARSYSKKRRDMYREHGKWWSNSLGKEMEFFWFGKFGRPVLLFPTSSGSFRENDDMHITTSLADKVDAGEIQLVLVDAVNNESWYNKGVHPAVRAARHAQYDASLRHEMVPYIFNRAQRGDLAVYGASFGAYHAANFAARYPDVVSRAICFSGVYDIHSFLDGYWDETCYFIARRPTFRTWMASGWASSPGSAGSSPRGSTT